MKLAIVLLAALAVAEPIPNPDARPEANAQPIPAAEPGILPMPPDDGGNRRANCFRFRSKRPSKNPGAIILSELAELLDSP
ncbi:unnamed protein product [Cutaneotrichosporon oleaginosum]